MIAIVGTFSGPESWRGEDALEGADVGVEMLNQSGSAGSRYELERYDDRGDAGRATALVAQAALEKDAIGIVYAGPPEGLAGAEAALAAARIPAVLCYGDLYGARLLRPHLFQTSPSLVWQARRIATYLVRDRGYRTIGALASESLTGTTARAALRIAVVDAGGEAPFEATYARPKTSLRSALLRLKRRRVEAVVVEGSPSSFRRVIQQLARMGAAYRGTDEARLGSAPRSLRRERLRSGVWRPQVAGYDLAMSPDPRNRPPPGTVASDTYARGAHYLPLPSLERFRSAFLRRWGRLPLGWERRAFEAVGMIGWASRRVDGRRDLARVLERLRGARLGGLAITLGPDDHTAAHASTVGLWVVPRDGIKVPERRRVPASLPWVPLARGFSIDGQRTDVLAEDWRFLFEDAPPRRAPPPRVKRMRFGVTTPRSDPVH